MPTSPQSTDHPQGALLGKAQHLLVWLIDSLLGLLRESAPDPDRRTLRFWIREYLAPAEAALRRAVRVLASGLAPLPIRTQTTQPPPRAASPPSPAVRRPVFRLNEPAPRKTAFPLARRARISIAGEAPPPAPAHGKADTATLHAHFLRRLDALGLAFENPLRLARRLIRQRRPDRKLTLAYAKPPGARAKSLTGEGCAILRRLNDAAMQAELRPDTS